ncbi:PTS sugar transporter subunit IIA [Liquorilactobacillus ghanensis]|uniref:PTS sugar transporter subunit IIA n=1 Tax=Liquorilactobacillus ghanensis TaxID=399370 RepID=UPI0039EA7C7C
MKVILIGHANTAIAMKKAVEMIYGEAPDFYPLTFSPKEGLADLKAKLEAVVAKFSTDQILVVTDLFSGTPYNAAAALAINNQVTDVIAGMSLPICLEIVSLIRSATVAQVVDTVMKNYQSYTKAFSIVSKNDIEEDDL